MPETLIIDGKKYGKGDRVTKFWRKRLDDGYENEALPILLEYLSKEYFRLDGVFKRLGKTKDTRIIPYLIDYIVRDMPLGYKLVELNPFYWILKPGLKAMGDDVPTSNKKAAANILNKLTGQNYTYKQVREWKKWWKANSKRTLRQN